MAAREEGSGGISERCISLLEEVKEIIEGTANRNASETAAGGNVATSDGDGPQSSTERSQ